MLFYPQENALRSLAWKLKYTKTYVSQIASVGEHSTTVDFLMGTIVILIKAKVSNLILYYILGRGGLIIFLNSIARYAVKKYCASPTPFFNKIKICKILVCWQETCLYPSWFTTAHEAHSFPVVVNFFKDACF